MSEYHDGLIRRFCEITGEPPMTAFRHLQASDWDIENATAMFYDPDTRIPDEADESQAAAPSSSAAQSSSSSRSAPKPKARSNIATFGDLGRNDEDEDDDDAEKKRQDLFAGGEKSGLAIQNPGESNSGNRLINDILRHAAEGGRRGREEGEDDSSASQSRSMFSGSGRTLGGEGSESVTIPDPNPPARAPDVVQRTLTFWRDGFSVEDGPLYRYDDPNNRQILQAIEAGRAPLSLMNVEIGQTADVRVYKRLDEDYVQPKKKFVPFSGQGQRLGDASAVSTPPPASEAAPQATPAAASSSQSQSVPSVDVDSSAPTTNIQIRLGDGTRLVSRFNHTHTVGDIYSFVNAASVGSRSREYILQTTFPTRELQDHAQTVKDAGLINAVVVQKWVA